MVEQHLGAVMPLEMTNGETDATGCGRLEPAMSGTEKCPDHFARAQPAPVDWRKTRHLV
jgi:hypothetical protein